MLDEDLKQMVALMRGLIQEKCARERVSPFVTGSEDAAEQSREKRERSSSDEEGAKHELTTKASRAS